MGRFLRYFNDPNYGAEFFLGSIDKVTTSNSNNKVIPGSVKFGLKTASWGHTNFPDPTYGNLSHQIGAFLTAEKFGPATAWDITSANEYYGFILHDLWPMLSAQERNNWAMEQKDFDYNFIGIQMWIINNERN